MAIVRDKLWIVGIPAHSMDKILFGSWEQHMDKELRIGSRSRISPMDGAFMLDIPNVIMMPYDGNPVPFSEEALGYMESFYPLSRVLWGGNGTATRKGDESAFVREMVHTYPNLCGMMAEDPALVAAFRQGLDKAARPMELWMAACLETALAPESIGEADGVMLWWHRPLTVTQIEERLTALTSALRGKKVLLALPLMDFETPRVLNTEEFSAPCERVLRWLLEKRIDGIAFTTNASMGVRHPSEYWLREWVDKVKYTEVPD